jgi:hypothetical protein
LEKEIESRKNLSLTDIEKLSADLPNTYTKEILRGEIFLARYGMDRILKQYAGLPLDSKIHVLFEHGILFTDYVGGAFRIHEYLPSMVASKYRVDILKKQKNYHGSYAIGPYIHYAESLLSNEEIKEEKERLGRTLLVFPSHSIDCITAHYDYQSFIDKINEVKRDFDSVRICMYYQDINLKHHLPYQKEGYEIVTAGHFNDYNFLKRLKSIIMASDMTMANDIGTHLGYCIYLGKPHYLTKQSVDYDVTDVVNEKNTKEAKEKLNKSDNVANITRLFSDYNEEINQEQHDLISYLWGFNEIKTKNELYTLIKQIDSQYNPVKYYLSCIKRTKDLMIEKIH